MRDGLRDTAKRRQRDREAEKQGDRYTEIQIDMATYSNRQRGSAAEGHAGREA